MTIRTMLKGYVSRDGTIAIVVRISKGDKQRDIPVGYKILPAQFKNGEVVKHPDAGHINSIISRILSQAKTYVTERQLKGEPINIDLIGDKPQMRSFTAFIEHRAKQYAEKEMLQYAGRLNLLVSNLNKCFNRQVYFEKIDDDFCNTFDAWLISQKNSANYRHKKFKVLRQLFSQGGRGMDNPFNRYHIKQTTIKKEKLTPAEIEMLEEADLEGALNHTRNLFLFSYYAKGLRFGNCITLKHSDIYSGRINTVADKGRKPITIKIHAKLQGVIDKYRGTGFIFPFVQQMPKKKAEQISMLGSINAEVNKNLKMIAGQLKIKKHISFHIARHSFAYNLKRVTNNIHAIQNALGHSSQKTTEVYLRELDDDIMDGEMAKLYGD